MTPINPHDIGLMRGKNGEFICATTFRQLRQIEMAVNRRGKRNVFKFAANQDGLDALRRFSKDFDSEPSYRLRWIDGDGTRLNTNQIYRRVEKPNVD